MSSAWPARPAGPRRCWAGTPAFPGRARWTRFWPTGGGASAEPAMTRSALPRWPELRVTLAFIALAGALWGFVWLAGEVLEGDTRAFDTRLLLLRNPADASDP